jgi:PAS domain S-box-containing protein
MASNIQEARRESNQPPGTMLPAGGEMKRLTYAKDWSDTALGPVRKWPQSLKSAVEIMLNSRYPMLVWWGPKLIQLYNDAYTPVLGLRHPSGLGQPAAECWSEAWPTVGPLADAVMTQGVSTWNERLQIVMTRNGWPEEVYMTFSYSPITDESGGIGGLFCACTEETQRVLGERRLRSLRALSEEAGQAATIEEACSIAADVLGRDRYDVPFALIYLNDTEGHHAKLTASQGISPESRACMTSIDLLGAQGGWPLNDVTQTGSALEIDLAAAGLEPAPNQVWPEPVTRALVLPLGRPGQEVLAGFVIAGISPRLNLDEGYRTFLELVARQVATAIASARAYEEERRRAEMLAELDRAKTAFFSNVSHEFRTPLTLMLGPLEDELRAKPESSPNLDIAYRNALRLLKLVNTLLDFSRIEAGRIDAVYEPVDLAALTIELASNFRSAIEKAGLRLVVDCPPVSAPVYVDPHMWEKIVLNLLSNAVKFTFEGEIEVRLRERAGAAELSVRDTGVGIPTAELPRIFERFHRVRDARSRTHEGTGIGLALVQELVKLHSGEIEVESIEGAGTTFRVSIPLGTSHLPADRIGAARTLSPTSTGARPFIEEALHWTPGEATEWDAHLAAETNGDRGTVLIADDNTDMREYLERLLSERYRVLAVADGNAALVSAREHQPDLIVSDIMMPGLDGYALLQRLRASPQTASIPILLLSARAGEEARVEGLQRGADDYLVKPFSARELLARVQAHITSAAVRKAEEKILRQNAQELKRRVGERTKELEETNEALRQEVSGRERGERALRVNENRLRAQKEAFQASINGAPLAEPLRILARLVSEETGNSVRTAFYVSDREEARLHPIRGAGDMPDCYLDLVDGFAIGPKSLACGLAHASRSAVMTRDVMGEPLWKSWRHIAEAHDFRGCWSFPVETSDHRCIGTFAMYFREPHDPAPEEVALAGVVAQTASIILSRHREAEERARAEEALRQSEQRLQKAISIDTVGVLFLNLGGPIQEANEAFAKMSGYTRDELRSIRDVTILTAPEFMECTRQTIANVAATGETPPYEKQMIRKDGSRWWGLFAPTRLSGSGMNSEAVEFVIDITDRKQAESALEESERRFRLLVDNVQEYALLQTDLEGIVASWNPGAERLFGYGSAEMLGQSAERLFSAEDRQVLRDELALVHLGKRHVEARWMVRKDGTRFWAQWVTEPVHDDMGRLCGVVKVLRDETERKQAEERQELLMAELNHRVKNTLAIVQSIASQTLRGATDPQQFVKTFKARLQALSLAHSLLTRRSWESADVTDLMHDQLSMDDGDAERITLDGPPALLTPQSAVALSLVLHELGTNARKYGALSGPTGRLSVRWHVARPSNVLHIDWEETGGPPVKKPERGGFGTTLIEKSMGGAGGSAQLLFDNAGLRCTISVPLSPRDKRNRSTSEKL